MTTLKQDLKRFVSILLFITIFFSCQSLKVNSVTKTRLDNKTESLEYSLPVLEESKGYLVVTRGIEEPVVITEAEESSLPLPSLLLNDSPIVSKAILENVSDESELLLPDVKKIVKKPKPVKKEVRKSSNTVSVSKKEIIKKIPVKPKTETKKRDLKPEVSKKSDREVLLLGKKDVISGKIFTIEMDQTGWLFEKQVPGIKFENKYFTSDKVLFNFTAFDSGNYIIEFVKYDLKGKSFSKVEINSIKEEVVKEKVLENKEQVVITPVGTLKRESEKSRLEKDLKNIDRVDNPDEVYFKLANIYYDEGLLKRSKELFEYIYDNYPLSIYYEESEEKMNYIIDNFLKLR